MFHEPGKDRRLGVTALNALVLPRPIGWVSTIDVNGRVNLAPYSFFNAIAYDPPQVMFAATGPHGLGGPKDSVRGAVEGGELVFSLVTWALRDAMNATSVAAPSDVDEFAYAGLTAVPSRLVKPPRVGESPVALECVVDQVVDLASGARGFNRMTIARVVGIHVDEAMMVDGRLDPRLLDPLARLGYDQYCRIGEIVAVERPVWSGG